VPVGPLQGSAGKLRLIPCELHVSAVKSNLDRNEIEHSLIYVDLSVKHKIEIWQILRILDIICAIN
jgi:hypothetical protein